MDSGRAARGRAPGSQGREVGRQTGHVFAPLAQWRKQDRKDAEAIEQIGTESAGRRFFLLAVLRDRGAVSDDDLAGVKAAGYTDGEVAEIVAHVALNVFTNYFNRTAQTEIDFPRVVAGQAE
jgi:hypothetical protein